MMKTLQIRDVPEEIHTAVRVRAAAEGKSVSDYLRGVVDEVVSRPTMAEFVARAKAIAQAGGGASLADVQEAVRSGRDR